MLEDMCKVSLASQTAALSSPSPDQIYIWSVRVHKHLTKYQKVSIFVWHITHNIYLLVEQDLDVVIYNAQPQYNQMIIKVPQGSVIGPIIYGVTSLIRMKTTAPC